MTTKEKLILMDDIKRKNDIAWSKYANQAPPALDVGHGCEEALQAV